jgi:hypothetical protein
MPDSKSTNTKASTAGGRDQSQAGSTDPFAAIRSLHGSAVERVPTEDRSTLSQKTPTLVDDDMSKEDEDALRKENSARRQRLGPSVSNVSK